MGAITSETPAQDVCVQYHLVPRTVYEKRPVTRYRWVTETAYETRQITESVPVYSTEKRERVTYEYKPVTKTSMREEEYEVLKPITETKYRERTYEVTEYETVNETRDEQIVVETPVRETRFREETVLVRKPYRKTEMRTEDVTTYRPVPSVETDLIPANIVTNQLAITQDRSRLKWLERGYYWEPTEGKYVFRRPGFHWTNPGPRVVNQPTVTSGYIPQQRTTTRMIAETTRRQRPVEVIDYDERIEVRKIPYEVERTEQRVETRKVPVQVRRPVTRLKTERIPYEETRYETVRKVRRVPVEEVTHERVEKVEPYERTTARWVEKTRQVQVPKTVRRRVAYEVMENVPRTVWMKVPVDSFGNVVGAAIPIESTSSTTSSTTFDRPVQQTARRVAPESSASTGNSVLDRSKELQESSGRRQRIEYDRPRSTPDTNRPQPEDSIIVPESTPSASNAETSMIQVRKRPTLGGERDVEKDQGSQSKQPTQETGRRVRPIEIEGEFLPTGNQKANEVKDSDPDLGPNDDLRDDAPQMIDT